MPPRQKSPSSHSRTTVSSSSSNNKENKENKMPSSKKKSSSSSSGGKTKLTFQIEQNQTCFIPTRKEFTAEEVQSIWYNGKEYEKMEEECDVTTEMIESGDLFLYPHHRKKRDPEKDKIWCSRGLEGWTDEGEERKEYHTQKGIELVWNAQLVQWQTGKETDWSEIAKDYAQISKVCHNEAAILAKYDEKEVTDYLSSARTIERTRQKLVGLTMSSSKSKKSKKIRKVSRRGSSGTKEDEMDTDIDTDDDEDEDDEEGATSTKKDKKRSSSKEKSLSSSNHKDQQSTASGKLVSPKPKKRSSTSDAASVDSRSTVSSAGGARKISFKPKKKKGKIPLSPVNSVCSEGSSSKRFVTTMSVASDDSKSKRRMVKAPPLS